MDGGIDSDTLVGEIVISVGLIDTVGAALGNPKGTIRVAIGCDDGRWLGDALGRTLGLGVVLIGGSVVFLLDGVTVGNIGWSVG